MHEVRTYPSFHRDIYSIGLQIKSLTSVTVMMLVLPQMHVPTYYNRGTNSAEPYII